MQTRSVVLAGLVALAFGQAALAQFPAMGPAGSYPAEMMSGPLAGPGPYGPAGFAPASYAAMGGQAPMGGPAPMGGMGPMGAGMPMAPTYAEGAGGGYGGMGGGYCEDCNNCLGWGYRANVFGDFLYLRPRNAEVAYAVPATVVTAGAFSQIVQAGPARVVDPDFSPGFRVGGGFALGDTGAFVATYAQYAAETQDTITLAGGGPVLQSLVAPDILSVGTGGLSAAASNHIQFKLLDLDYKGLIANNDSYRAAYVIGARYAKLDQNFDGNFQINGFEGVASRVRFDGGGLKLGLEGEKYSLATNFFGYGRASASFVGGQFRTTYNLFDGTGGSIVDTGWKAGRMVTISDLEVGAGWRNFTNNLRFSLGYMYSSWFNVVKQNDWITSVQANSFVNPSDSTRGIIAFDGLVGRIEYQW